ncbi:MAG: methyl-accepting chemotaxis protein [Cyanobacteria bacterium P01_H01_bin.121]
MSVEKNFVPSPPETTGSRTGQTNGGQTNGGQTNGSQTNGSQTNGGQTNGKPKPVAVNGQATRQRQRPEPPVDPELESYELDPIAPIDPSDAAPPTRPQKADGLQQTYQELKQDLRLKPSLRRRLLTTVIPLVLTPLAVASLVGYGLTRISARAQALATLAEDSRLTSEAGQKFVDDSLLIPEVVALSPLVQKSVSDANRLAQERRLNEIPIDRLEAEYPGRILTPNAALAAYLRAVAAANDIAEMFVTNEDGLNVGYTNLTSDFVQKDENWWQVAKEQGFEVEPPEFDPSAKEVVVGVSQAIFSPVTGNFVGVTNINVPLETLHADLDEFLQASLQNTERIQLIDVQSQQLVDMLSPEGVEAATASNSANPFEGEPIIGGEPLLAIATKLQELEQDSSMEVETLNAELNSYLRGAANHVFNATLEGASGGERRIMATFVLGGRTYSVTTVPKTDWVSVASIARSELNAAGRDLLVIFAITGAILSLAAVLLTLLLANRLSRPLTELSAATEQVAAGNLDVEAPALGTTETVNLATSFNNLVGRVKELLSRQQSETARAQSLAAIAQANSDSEMETPLNEHLAELRQKLQTDRVVVYRLQPDFSGLATGEAVKPGLPSVRPELAILPAIAPEAAATYKEGQVIPTANVWISNQSAAQQQLMQQLQVQATLAAPIKVAGDLFGLLVTHHCTEPHHWSPAEIELLQTEAEQLGIAMSSLAAIETQKLAVDEQQRRREALELQLFDMMERIESAAEGDLTTRAQLMEGEIGIMADLFNSVIENLQDIAIQVRDSSGQVNQSLNQNETAIRRLAERAILETKGIQKALGSVQSMAQSIQTVAQNAGQASAIANSAYASVQAGNDAMDSTVSSIVGLRSTIGDTAKKMKRLGESAQKISQIVALIDELALKTNLLSINASVEAARAGELGQGFTAVAEQVGALAEQSAAATKEIAKTVTSIQAETQELVEAMEVGTTQVVDSTQQVEKTKVQLAEILQRSQAIDQLMREISTSTVAQTQAAANVTTIMQQVTQASKQRSLASRQVAQAMQATAKISQGLQSSVEQFKVE